MSRPDELRSKMVARVQERRAKVAALVKEGFTERQIAAELGVSRTTVWTDKQVGAVQR